MSFRVCCQQLESDSDVISLEVSKMLFGHIRYLGSCHRNRHYICQIIDAESEPKAAALISAAIIQPIENIRFGHYRLVKREAQSSVAKPRNSWIDAIVFEFGIKICQDCCHGILVLESIDTDFNNVSA